MKGSTGKTDMNNVTLRKFTADDVESKVKWINDPVNNEFLHYNIPLDVEKTHQWFENTKDNQNRHDMIIEYGGVPVGVIGIINIGNKKGEYYITLGEHDYRRRGISYEATKLVLDFAFNKLGLQKVWLCVDEKNVAARKLYEKVGFSQEGLLRKDIYFKGEMINRCMYGILREEWINKK